MALNWKPAAELPPFEAPTSILIGYPAVSLLDDVAFALGFANADAIGGVRLETTGESPDDGWYWVTEDELLAGLRG